jgi:hypothetical protein
MRHSHAASTVAVLTAGLTAAVVLSRHAARRVPATAAPALALAPVAPVEGPEGVVLPFLRVVSPAPEPVRGDSPARCGDSGGSTKAGTPCGVRVAAGGRCHHHQLAA